MAKTKKSTALDVARGVLAFLVNIIVLAIAVIAVVQVCRLSYELSYQIFGEVVVSEPPGENIPFAITEGESEWSVSERLEKEDLVINKFTFFIRLKLTVHGGQKLSPGAYTLNTSMTYDDLLKKIVVTDEG